MQTPLITASDCEGAGEMFRVTTLDIDDVEKLPRAKDEEGNVQAGVDYGSDFFGKAAFLVRDLLSLLWFHRVMYLLLCC